MYILRRELRVQLEVFVLAFLLCVVQGEINGLLSEENKDSSFESEMFSQEAWDVTENTEMSAKNPRQALKNDLMRLFEKDVRFVVALLPSETLEYKYERTTPPHPDE
ncbi:unnamed protein product [Parnassius apollo]|uniref:(apollo) hypothetical protein n=1 Tax=Parnassius apollo TaxID=110799 RepID=A0A8S3W544_PARAO|nr:unnamed protein product [Parnassius apollo]